MARQTVERATPSRSATSAVLYSPLRTSETKCASWRRFSFGCLPQMALGLGHLHPFPGPEADEVGLELGHHGQDVEQQPPDRVGGVADRSAQVQADLTGGELVGDRPGVRQGAGETVELGDHQAVAGPASGERLAQPRPLPVVPVRP